MWADWLRNYIPRELSGHAVSFTKYHADRVERALERRAGDPHSRRIKCVCRTCNNGWMSHLQEMAKPYIVPLLHGTAIAPGKTSQKILATWITMMVMVAEHLIRELVAIPPYERDWFRLNLQPPPTWRIWLGHHAATHHALFSHNVVSFATEEEIQRLGLAAGEPSNTQTSTILLGKHLLIYVMSSSVAFNIIGNWQIPSQFAASLVEIWPFKHQFAAWPPIGGALRDTAIGGLADHFFNACMASTRVALPPK
jgi:hypothetical protein